MNRGAVYNDMGWFDAALAQYDQALEIEPDDSGCLAGRAIALAGLERYREAFDLINKLISAHPRDPDFLYTRGHMFATVEQHENAVKDYSDCLKLDATHMKALNNRGASYMKLGKFKEALADLDKVIQERPQEAFAYLNRSQVHRLNNMKAAIADANKGVELSGNSPSTIAIRAEIYRNAGMFKESIADFKTALEADPDNAHHLEYLGLAYYADKQAKEAIQCYEKVLELKPDYPIGHYHMGHAHKQLKEYKEAIAWYEKALELDQNLYFAHLSMGECHAKLNETEKARKEIATAEQQIETLRKQIPDRYEGPYAMACLKAVSSITHGKAKNAKKAAEKDRADAVKYLEESVTKGMWDYAHIETDEDLESIRNEKAYKALIKKMKG